MTPSTSPPPASQRPFVSLFLVGLALSIAGAAAAIGLLIETPVSGPLGTYAPVVVGVAFGLALVAWLAGLYLLRKWRIQVGEALAEGERARGAVATVRDFERLFRFGTEPMLVIDPDPAAILDINNAASAAFEAPRELFVGQSLDTIVAHGYDAKERIRATARTGDRTEYDTTHHNSRERIAFRVVNTRIEFRGKPAVLSVYRDVTAQRAFERQLTEKAFRDPLTGLANRPLFHDRIAHAVSRLDRQPQTIITMLLDLDDFRSINESLGAQGGDQVLSEIGARITRCLRTTDTAAHLDGDQFAILLEDAKHPYDATSAAERLMEALVEPIEVGGRRISLSASIGIAVTEGGDDTESLLRKVEVAMYNAKKKGKGCYEIFDPALHAAAAERVDLRNDFRQALSRKEFLLEYQPIWNLASGTLVGVEALVRWDHPTRGRIAPGAFIPLAEASGLMTRLGTWVIEQSCRQGRRWLDEHPDRPLLMAINISERQIRQSDPDLSSAVREILDATGFPAGQLLLEITEGMMITNADATLDSLNKVRDIGVRIALDDFGTGYSSLRSLQHFPIDLVKIDRTFTEGLDGGGSEGNVAVAIVGLGRILRLTPIAEGISSARQLNKLRTIGCELGQGHHLGEPVAAEDISALLKSEPVQRIAAV